VAKTERMFDTIEDLVDEVFDGRKVSSKYAGKLAVQVTAVVLVSPGSVPSYAVADGIVDGHYVYLTAKTTKAELREVLDERLKVNRKRSNLSAEAVDDHKLTLPG